MAMIKGALDRLGTEAAWWRGENNPPPQVTQARTDGFEARPVSVSDLRKWICKVPGPKGTAWEGGVYPIDMTFPDNWPMDPPTGFFQAAGSEKFFHPNVSVSNGKICVSVLNSPSGHGDYSPLLQIHQLLKAIQTLLIEPTSSAFNGEAWSLFQSNKSAYEAKIKQQAQRFKKSGPTIVQASGKKILKIQA